MKILPSHKNELFESIISRNLIPEEDIIIENEDFENFKLIVPNTDFFISFYFNDYEQCPYVDFSPALNKPLKNYPINYDWNVYIKYIDEWLNYLKIELNQPDKWGDFIKISKSVTIPLNDWDDNKFDYHEVEQIKEKLNLLKEQIKQLALPPEKENIINVNIDYLSIKAETSQKRDWLMMVVGSFAGAFIQAAITPDTINKIWGMVTQLFSNVPLLK